MASKGSGSQGEMVYQRSDTARSACTTTLSQHRSAARAIGGFKAAVKLNETGRERFGVGAAHPGRTVWIVDIPADEAAHHRHFNDEREGVHVGLSGQRSRDRFPRVAADCFQKRGALIIHYCGK